MSKTKEIDHRIERLKQKKKQLEKTQALGLYKKLHQIMKEEFSPELAMAILTEVWSKATTEQKEVWLNKAESFRFPKRERPRRKTSQNHPKDPAPEEPEKRARLSLFKSPA